MLTKARDLDAKRCELLVLDEADRVLGMGFAKTLNSIIAGCRNREGLGCFRRRDGGVGGVGKSRVAKTGTCDSERFERGGGGSKWGNKNEADKKTGAGGASVGSKLPTQLDLSYRICESVDAKIFRLTAFLKAKKGKKIIVFSHMRVRGLLSESFGDAFRCR